MFEDDGPHNFMGFLVTTGILLFIVIVGIIAVAITGSH